MHENNGNFFWWGGRPGQYGTAMLYREVYNRMVNVHHPNNLEWVWNQNGPANGGEFYNFYPGPQYADVVSYDNHSVLSDRFYQEILTIANGKPIAPGEVGYIPTPDVLKAQPKWTFYMTWGGMSGAGGGAGGGRGAGRRIRRLRHVRRSRRSRSFRRIRGGGRRRRTRWRHLPERCLRQRVLCQARRSHPAKLTQMRAGRASSSFRML
jgi:hypothetical protein